MGAIGGVQVHTSVLTTKMNLLEQMAIVATDTNQRSNKMTRKETLWI